MNEKSNVMETSGDEAQDLYHPDSAIQNP